MAESSPAAETVIAADSIPDPAPPAPQVTESAEEADETVTTTGTFTRTDTTATWQAGMSEPAVTTDTQTVTVGETDAAAVADAVIQTTPAAEEPAAVAADEPAAVVVETPVAPEPSTADFAPGEGVLVFLDDTPAAEPPATTPVDVVEVDQAQQSGEAETISEMTSVASQHYHDGKLVSAARATTTITGEITSVVSDHSSLLEEVEQRAATPSASDWVDVSPLSSDTSTGSAQAANTPADSAQTANAPAAQPNSDTNLPGGGLATGGDNPGGGLATGGGDNPGGDLGNSGGTSGSGDTNPPEPRRGPNQPIPE